VEYFLQFNFNQTEKSFRNGTISARHNYENTLAWKETFISEVELEYVHRYDTHPSHEYEKSEATFDFASIRLK